MDIDFFTFLSRNSADYAEYLKYTAEKFKSGKHNIHYKCIESVGCERLPKGYKCIAKTGSVGHNSSNHAVALNYAQRHIENDYVIFVDADIAIVHKDWDDIIVNELNKNDAFGGAYNDKIKYKNFPTVYFFCFHRDKFKLDFSPEISKGGKPIKIVLGEEAKYYNMKKGDILKCDTGYKLALLYNQLGLKSDYMPMILTNSKKRQLPFVNGNNKKISLEKPTHMCEFHYKGKLFATHKQASRNHPLNGKYGKAWKDRVNLYIKENKL